MTAHEDTGDMHTECAKVIAALVAEGYKEYTLDPTVKSLENKGIAVRSDGCWSLAIE